MVKYLHEDNRLVEREAGGYQYITDKLEVVHTTSVPMTDQEAMEYTSIIQLRYPTVRIAYLSRRPMDGYKYDLFAKVEENRVVRL